MLVTLVSTQKAKCTAMETSNSATTIINNRFSPPPLARAAASRIVPTTSHRATSNTGIRVAWKPLRGIPAASLYLHRGHPIVVCFTTKLVIPMEKKKNNPQRMSALPAIIESNAYGSPFTLQPLWEERQDRARQQQAEASAKAAHPCTVFPNSAHVSRL